MTLKSLLTSESRILPVVEQYIKITANTEGALTCAKYCSQHSPCIVSFNAPNNPRRRLLSLS